MDFTRIDLESTAPPEYLCCEKCLKAYINDTVATGLRCPKCGMRLWGAATAEGIEQHLKLLEEMKK